MTLPTSHSIAHVLRYAQATPWAITRDKLSAIAELLALRSAGLAYTTDEVRARVGIADGSRMQAARYGAAGGAASGSARRAVAVLPIVGTIVKRANLMTETSGGQTLDGIAAQFRALVADDSVAGIVLDVDSPGGSVDGVPEFADEVFNARGTKPIVAVADPLTASAAYWIASQADEIVVSPSGQVGSIGVFSMHVDESKALEQEGLVVTLIDAGKFKTEGNPFEPLTDEARAAVQDRVDTYYDQFVEAVARGRGVSAADVRGGFGQGRVVLAEDAVAEGMADRVGTLEQELAAMGVVSGPGTSARANSQGTRAGRTHPSVARAQADLMERGISIGGS